MDLARLDKLHDMMKKGVITKKEFNAEKAKLILDDAGDTTPLDRLEKLNDLPKRRLPSGEKCGNIIIGMVA